MKLNRALLIIGLLLTSVGVSAQNESAIKSADNLRLSGAEDPNTSKVYIVQLRSPSAAEHHASLMKSSAGRAVILAADEPRPRFQKNNAAVQAYTARLDTEQQQVLDKTGPGVQKIYS